MNQSRAIGASVGIGFCVIVAYVALAQTPVAQSPQKGEQVDQLTKQLLDLEKRSQELELELQGVVAKRVQIKKALADLRDFGCECDDDFCHTERQNELVNPGEKDLYCHDDQDFGDLSIRCVDGQIQVIIYRAVWSDWVVYDSKFLSAGENWNRRIDEANGTFDQTNIVEVWGRGNTDSHYSMDFKSWDP